MQIFEVRCPVHGFIKFNELEWDVINSLPFQRLRRIRQLGWTDYVYPGAMHTRFEHSLGVCQTATRIFETITSKDADVLQSEYAFTPAGIERQRQIIRLGALLHDLGHGPFSHAAEEVLPFDQKGEHYSHEAYSAAIAQRYLRDVIEGHPFNPNNFRISIDEITSLFAAEMTDLKSIVWREIISGQMDADRMDYLLRDSFHAGVSYGRYDLDRLISSIRLCEDPDEDVHRIGVADDGIHAVEGLIIARYMMFMQVYFHKTDQFMTSIMSTLSRSCWRVREASFLPPMKGASRSISNGMIGEFSVAARKAGRGARINHLFSRSLQGRARHDGSAD